MESESNASDTRPSAASESVLSESELAESFASESVAMPNLKSTLPESLATTSDSEEMPELESAESVRVPGPEPTEMPVLEPATAKSAKLSQNSQCDVPGAIER